MSDYLPAIHQPENVPLRPEQLAPHNIDAEESLLGSLVVNPTIVPQVIAILKPEDFFIRKNEIVYRAILRIIERHDHLDDLTLTDELEQSKQLDQLGGVAYLTRLGVHTVNTQHALTYARLVQRYAIRRRLIAACAEIVQAVQTSGMETEKLIEYAHNALTKAGEGLGRSAMESIGTVARRIYNKSVAAYENGVTPGIATGLDALHELIGPLLYRSLILVGGRPGSGKSALCADLALVAARAGKVVAWFSLEMGNDESGYRLVARIDRIPSQKNASGQMDHDEWTRFTDATVEMDGLPIFLNDASRLSVDAIVGMCSTLAATRGLDMVIVDYLQLLDSDDPNRRGARYEDVADIAQRLKSDVAGKLGVCCVVAAQFNRDCEKRQNKTPILSDFALAGEAAADLCIGVYRPEMYDENTIRPSQADLVVLKNRHGPTGVVTVHFNKSLTHFSDLKAVILPYPTNGHVHYTEPSDR